MSATPIKVNPSRCASVLGTSAMLVAVNSTTVGVMGPSAVPRAAGHVAPGGSADTNGVFEAGYVRPHDEACHFVGDVVAVVTGVEDVQHPDAGPQPKMPFWEHPVVLGELIGGVAALSGIGSGMFASPNSSSIMGSVPARDRGSASGMRSTFQNSGTAVSIGVVFTLMIAGLSSSLPTTLSDGLTRAQRRIYTYAAWGDAPGTLSRPL
jgi:hypothetical protein